jgi:hypothetical protein
MTLNLGSMTHENIGFIGNFDYVVQQSPCYDGLDDLENMTSVMM